MVRRWRPELDVYLTTDRDVARLAGSAEAAPIRRIFYGVEEPMEIHLAILDGVKDRYETPYFDNLKNYAQRPIGTFHALPVARGKSIFKSNWIRDMGEFYGANLFLAESSATTGGLDSLLEPTGNIKVAQDKAARALGGDRSFFVTNGTSTSNKIVHQALLKPGDIVLIDRDCHKSHHYGLVLAGAQPLYIDAFPLTQYSMYGSLAIKPIKKALLQLKAEGKLDRAKMLVLTNCTFDGHVANVKRTMLECLAIKPDLIFLWDEAWFGFARFSPFLRRRTAMGAAAAIRDLMRDPEYRKRYEAFKASAGKLDPKDPKLVDMELLPDPDKVRVRVYETDSVHKSMSSLRQGSIIVVADQDFHTVEASFKEAFFTHTSTSPNLQIIASLDVARRQMELEGYELVGRAHPAGDRDPARDQRAPADLEVLPRRHAGRDDPRRVPEVGLHRLGRAGLDDDRHDRRAGQRRVLPRPDPDHAALRRRGLRRDASSRRSWPASTTSRSTRPRATACSSRSTSTTRGATWRT